MHQPDNMRREHAATWKVRHRSRRLDWPTRLIRNRRKIEATIQNAQTMLDLDQQHQGFKRYLGSLANYDALAADLIKRFKFLGKTGTHFFLYVVGEPVPNYHEVMA